MKSTIPNYPIFDDMINFNRLNWRRITEHNFDHILNEQCERILFGDHWATGNSYEKYLDITRK